MENKTEIYGLTVSGPIPIKLLSAARTEVNGLVQFNADEPLHVDATQPTTVPGVVMVNTRDVTPLTRMTTVQTGGGTQTVYLFYEGDGADRQYFESDSPDGSNPTAIPTTIVANSFLVLQLRLDPESEQPIIVIGTIIIDIEMETE